MNDDLRIEGYIGDYTTSYFYVQVLKCSPNSNITCKSEQEMEDFFAGKCLGIGYQNNNFDFNDYANPIQVLFS